MILIYILAIYRDYMFKKAIPDKITDIVSMNYLKDKELVSIFSVYVFFSVRIGKFEWFNSLLVDHRTYYWTKGVINYLVEVLLHLVNEENPNESLMENITLALYSLCLDNCKLKFIYLLKMIVNLN